tara:strand:+ start:1587 stop:1961 length:375 start_codon:yes stop_codon:yes gene_type:complete
MFPTRRKYGNKKVVVDGIKFDSKLELFCYNLLKEYDIDFEFQRKVVLFEKFKFNGKTIRAITMLVDFVLSHNGNTIYLDTKGFATETSKIKYKILKHKLKDDLFVDVVWLHTQKEVREFVNKLN